MERKPKVTTEAVASACAQLSKEGKNVTVNAVINITGGSFSTVGAMVKAWREEQREKAMPAFDMPDSITAAMREATTTIWSAASALAAENIETIQKQAQETTDKAASELSEYASEVTRLEHELSTSQGVVDDREKALAESRGQVSELTTKVAGLEARLDDRDTELKHLRSEYEKLQAELVAIAKGKK